MVRPARLTPEAQRAEIISAATQKLAKAPFEQFRLVALAETLGMSHSNLYRFFRSKEKLFDAVVDAWLEDSRQLIGKTLDSNSKPLDQLAAMLIAVHQSARDKLSRDPSGFALYQHLFNNRSEAAQKHVDFIVSTGVQLLSEAIDQGDVVIEDPVKAALLIQAATAKFHTPELIDRALNEDTVAQYKTVLAALFHALQTNPDCLSTL